MSSMTRTLLIALGLASLPCLAGTFNGTITDLNGKPLPGAKVLLAKTGAATSATSSGATTLAVTSTVTPPITTRIRSQYAHTQPAPRHGIELDGARLTIQFNGSDVLGRGAVRSATGTSVPSTVAGFRAGSYAGSDTIYITWNGSVRFRGLLDSLLSLPSVAIKIDTTAKTGDIPWKSTAAAGTLVDERDGQSYRTVKIGNQTWMAENLNYKVDSSWWYDNSAANGARYGRLYSWSAAMQLPSTADTTLQSISSRVQGICPTGWHIPSHAEWDTLAGFVREDTAAKALRCANCTWITDSALVSQGMRNLIVLGDDTYGFRMLGSGFYFLNQKKFMYRNTLTSFWTSDEQDSLYAKSANFSVDDEWYHTESANYKRTGTSLRCVQD